MEALKTAAHVLNLAPTKAAPCTPYEMWMIKKPSLNYLRVWGCPAEARVFNPQLKKLDPKTVSCFFVGYPHKGKGYRFYCPGHTTKKQLVVSLLDTLIEGRYFLRIMKSQK
jgi:hypothetical protein